MNPVLKSIQWLDPDNIAQTEWAYKYLFQKYNYVDLYQHTSSPYEKIHLLAEQNGDSAYLLKATQNMKRAWKQRERREALKKQGKGTSTFEVSNKAKKQLENLSKELKISQPATLERLLEGNYDISKDLQERNRAQIKRLQDKLQNQKFVKTIFPKEDELKKQLERETEKAADYEKRWLERENGELEEVYSQLSHFERFLNDVIKDSARQHLLNQADVNSVEALLAKYIPSYDNQKKH